MSYPCTRCGGSGRLRAHANVLGGVCFKCGGSGRQAQKPPKPAVLWAVYGHRRDTGAEARLYNFRARTPAEAVRKALTTFARCDEAGPWRQTYHLDNPSARPWTE